jgi:hypothetical protein
VTTERPLELLHMDLFGSVAYISIGGNKYGFVIIYDIRVSLGCSFRVIRVKCKAFSRSLQ